MPNEPNLDPVWKPWTVHTAWRGVGCGVRRGGGGGERKGGDEPPGRRHPTKFAKSPRAFLITTLSSAG